MLSWYMEQTMRVHSYPESELGKLPDEIMSMLNEPIEGLTRRERMDEVESDSFADFEAAAMGGFGA